MLEKKSLEYSKAFPNARIYSFEPFPETFEKLKAEVSKNPLISPENIAMSSERRDMYMEIGRHHSMNRVNKNAEDGVKIRADTIKNFCEDRGINEIDFLKIDTEGHEMSVLKGCGEFLKKISLVQCELSANSYNKFHASFVEVFEYMTDHGFLLFDLNSKGYEWTGGQTLPVLRRFDGVFINELLVGDISGTLRE